MRRAVYIIGAPGSGKSTVMSGLMNYLGLEPIGEHHLTRETFVTNLSPMDAWMWGRLRPEFPGTDSLGLASSRYCREWIEAHPDELPQLTLGEGARFSNLKFLLTLDTASPLLLVHLDCDPETTKQRCATRPGKTLTDKYQATVRTSVGRLGDDLETLGVQRLSFNTGDATVDEIVPRLARWM